MTGEFWKRSLRQTWLRLSFNEVQSSDPSPSRSARVPNTDEPIRGWARSASGSPVEGIAWIEQGIRDYWATGAVVALPYYLGLGFRLPLW